MHSFTRDGLHFDVTDAGPSDGPVAVLLHGFPQDRTCWKQISERLNANGVRTLAPDQRGYSPGARPKSVSAYAMPKLVADVLALIDAVSTEGAENVHLVGHDWGGAVAWAVAEQAPHKLSALTVLSTPHPAALAWSMTHSDQLRRSWYMGAMQIPWLPERRMSKRFSTMMAKTGLPKDSVDTYARRFSTPESLHGPINWYRAMARSGALRDAGSARVEVPTTFLWGRDDFALGRAAAVKTADFVTAPYEFVELDAGHWLPELEADRIAEAISASVLG